jgi:4-amino-4-deoxy-L-arabinose transferase-like glycosyltransferase
MQPLSKIISSHGPAILKALLFLLVIYCPFFLHLGDLPIRVWDEARQVANTLEMERNGNYLVTYFKGQPEMWNTKPPLLIWFQLFFLKLIGNEELAFRLPSAIAGFLTTLTILLVFAKYLKSYWFGLFTVLVLVTANGYIGDHVARTADYDALLTFFMIFYALCFFLFLETGRQKYLHLFFAGLAFSIFTKSIQGMLFIPALVIYPALTGNFLKLLKNKWVYIDFALVMMLVMGYYLLRESVNPGYLEAVYINELGGRFASTMEYHKHPFNYYLNLLISDQFAIWFLLVPLGFFAGLAYPKGPVRRMILYVALLSLGYLLIISSAGTKLAWYNAPVFPLLSILAAFTIYRVFLLIVEFKSIKGGLFKRALPVLFMILVFYLPYQIIIDKVYKPRESPGEIDFYNISHLLQDAVNNKTEVKDCFICYNGYNAHLQYYIDRLNIQARHVFFRDPQLLRKGDIVIYSEEFIRKKIDKKFLFEETGKYYNVKFIKINDIRNRNE